MHSWASLYEKNITHQIVSGEEGAKEKVEDVENAGES